MLAAYFPQFQLNERYCYCYSHQPLSTDRVSPDQAYPTRHLVFPESHHKWYQKTENASEDFLFHTCPQWLYRSDVAPLLFLHASWSSDWQPLHDADGYRDQNREKQPL